MNNSSKFAARAALVAVACLCSLANFAHAQSTSGVLSPLTGVDVGAPAIAGYTIVGDGRYAIGAGGTGVGETADQFHFAYMRITGDVDLVARIGSLAQSDLRATAGVMIRESLSSGSRYAMASVSSHPGPAFDRRIDAGGWSEQTIAGEVTEAAWLRVVRSGSEFHAYRSTDGRTWVTLGRDTIPMGASVYVGVAVTSHNAGGTTFVVVDNVRVAVPEAAPTPDPVPGPDPVPAPGPVSTDPVPTPPPPDTGPTPDRVPQPAPDPAPVPPSSGLPPRAVVFQSSADHYTLVTRYVLEIYAGNATPGVSSPVVTSDLGKPAPDENGEITADRTPVFQSLAAGSYVATVTAVGDGGSSRSAMAAFTR
jgi:hypothetical protein